MMPVPRVVIPVVALLLLAALLIICGLAILPYVVRQKLESVSNTNTLLFCLLVTSSDVVMYISKYHMYSSICDS